MADRNLRLQVILEGLDRLTAPLKSITGASSSARRDLAETQKQLKSLDALQQQVGRYKAVEGRFANDSRDLQEAQARVAALRAQLEATENPTKKLRSEFERAERQTAQLSARLDSGGAELQQLSAKLSAAGIDVTDLARHEDRLAMQTHEANQALKKQTAQLDKVAQASRNSQKLNDISAKATGAGIGMMGAGVAAGAPVVMAVKQAMTLESAMADVSKVTNMVPAQIEQMSNDFIDMSTKIPMAANELAAIAAAAGAAGVGMDKFGKPMKDQRQQLLDFTKDAAEMGVAFDMTADVAGETMAKWRTAFSMPQAGVRALGDSVNALTNTFGGKAANVTDIITRIGPLGKVGGLAAGEIAALGSTLDSIGVQSEIAATGIKNTMLALTKGDAATKAQAGAFKALGLDAVEMAKRMQTDASGAIVDVMERIGKLDEAKRPAILTQLFGSESVAAIAPLLTNLDGLKQRLVMVGDASATAGSMHAEFLNRIATTEGATGLATNALSGLNITMGKVLLPTVVAISQKVTEAAIGFRKWAQENPRLSKAIMLFMAVGAGLLILLGGLALGFAALTAAAAPLGIALGPLLAIVAAVAALAGAAYLIYSNWGSISPLFKSLGEAGSALFGKIMEAAGKFMDLLTILWNGPLGDRIRVVMTLVQELATIFGAAIGGTVVAVLNTLMGVAGAVFDFIGNAIGLVAAILTGDFAGAWTAVKGMFSAGADALIAILSGLKTIFMTIGGAIMDGLIAGLKAGWQLVKNTIGDIAGMMPDWVKKILGIHSPSRVFAMIGGHVMGGLDQGLADGSDGPLSRVKQVADAMADTPMQAGSSGIISRAIDLSGQMMRAVAAGSVAPAIAAAPVAAQPTGTAQAAPVTIHKSYEIKVSVQGGAPAQDIADQVRRALEEIERENRGRGFGDE